MSTTLPATRGLPHSPASRSVCTRCPRPSRDTVSHRPPSTTRGGRAVRSAARPIAIARADPAPISTGSGTGSERNWVTINSSRAIPLAAAAPKACASRHARRRSRSVIGVAGGWAVVMAASPRCGLVLHGAGGQFDGADAFRARRDVTQPADLVGVGPAGGDPGEHLLQRAGQRLALAGGERAHGVAQRPLPD